MNLTCPQCLTDCDTVSRLEHGDPEFPEPAICDACGTWLMIDEEGLRFPSKEERGEIASNPVCQAATTMWLIHARRA